MPFDEILAKVGSLILQALPTLFMIVILHFYLKSMLFKPLSKVLEQRDELTKGAKEKAEASLKVADEKAAQYEKAIRDARNELYKEQEAMRKQWITEQSAQIEQARAKADTLIRTAKEDIVKQSAESRQALVAQAEQLADRITSGILG